jgi:hypothetical protein
VRDTAVGHARHAGVGACGSAREIAPADPPTRHGLDIVIDAAGRARELVREILVFSRKDPVTNGAVRVDLLISEAIKSCAPVFPRISPLSPISRPSPKSPATSDGCTRRSSIS